MRQKQNHNKSITCNVCMCIKQVADSSKTTNLKQLQNMVCDLEYNYQAQGITTNSNTIQNAERSANHYLLTE